MGSRWPRDAYTAAVWAAPIRAQDTGAGPGAGLRPLERLVALAFADHARDQAVVWVTLARLTERTGMSRDAAIRAVQGLKLSGWLVEVERAAQHRAARYELTIPTTPEVRDSDPCADLSSTPQPPLTESRGTSPDTSSTPQPPLDGPRGTSGRPDYPRTSTDHSQLPLLAVPPATPVPTIGQRANRLADHYTQLVPLSSYPGVAGICRKALATAQWSDQELAEALTRLAADKRTVTINSLRQELDGPPIARSSAAHALRGAYARARAAEAGHR